MNDIRKRSLFHVKWGVDFRLFYQQTLPLTNGQINHFLMKGAFSSNNTGVVLKKCSQAAHSDPQIPSAKSEVLLAHPLFGRNFLLRKFLALLKVSAKKVSVQGQILSYKRRSFEVHYKMEVQ